MSVQVDTGYTNAEIRSKILHALNGHIHQNKLDELFSIFFDDADTWANREHLIKRITTTYDPIRLEEAARVVINPMIYYDLSSDRYYIFGG